MKPGKDLDKLVAEQVMGMTEEDVLQGPTGSYPCFSTDIAEAWKVMQKIKWLRVEMFEGEIFGNAILECTGTDPEEGWLLRYEFDLVEYNDRIADLELGYCAPTAPHAICLAALKALGVEI